MEGAVTLSSTLLELAATLENIRLELEEHTVILTMNRPKALNALSSQTLRELDLIFSQLASEREVLGVIITGEGKAFVAGADISQMKPYKSEEGRDYANYAQGVFNRIEALEKPVIAAVNGFALGGGCELAMSCDLRIASEKAVFGQPEVKLGLIPCFGGTQRLPRLVGTGRAKELIYTGRQVSAGEALEMGLVNRVVPAEELLGAAKDMMGQILAMSPVAVRYAKVAINRGLQADLHTGLELEKDICAVVFGSEDKQAGVDAFLEKRTPVFPNR
ncbi:Short-chain-enoyl-CoA hydratase [bioreactor metagenome]|uniref:Short-chain-enoyl-CoA hydratase n=1 Tax=bioreactor metagenome TaxID=1076179 RepID=A0A644XQE2_9ZZZZ